MKSDREELLSGELRGGPPDSESASERFFGAAIQRILRSLIVFGSLGTLFVALRFGSRPTIGFVLGTALAYENLRSLSLAVNSLGERIAVGHSTESGGRIVFQFIARILLVALAGCAIFIGSPKSLPGYLAGLCMPVAAMLWEAGNEAFAAFRRGL